MIKNIQIREALESDAADLIEYVNKIAGQTNFLTFGEGEFNKTKDQEKEIIKDYKKKDNQIFLLAFHKEKIIGALNVHASQKKRLQHIGEFGISVDENHWKQGIATQLMKHMIDWAKKSKVIRKLNLMVMTNNEAAISLYKKFGFKEEGKITRNTLLNKEFYDDYAMGLEID
jgi:RimJ/RimL family protein N-acetyltransferase